MRHLRRGLRAWCMWHQSTGLVPDWVKWDRRSQWVLTFPFSLLLSCGGHEHAMHHTPLARERLPHVSHATVDRSTANMIQSRPAKHLVAGRRRMPSTYSKEHFMHIEPWPEMYSEKRLGFLFDLEKALYLCLRCHINRLCRQGPVQLLLVSNYSSPMIFLGFPCFYSLWNWLMIQSQQGISPRREDFSHLRMSSLNTLFF